jgi:hypothetical protein
MTGQVTLSSETADGRGITIIAEYYYSPAEDAEYDGGMPSYPGCESTVEIEEYYAEDENTKEMIKHELSDRERDELEQKAIEKENERD